MRSRVLALLGAVACGALGAGCADENRQLVSQEWVCGFAGGAGCYCYKPHDDEEGSIESCDIEDPDYPLPEPCCSAERAENADGDVTFSCFCTSPDWDDACPMPEVGRSVDACPPEEGFQGTPRWTCGAIRQEAYRLITRGAVTECGPREGERCCVLPGTMSTALCACNGLCDWPGVTPVADCGVDSFETMVLPLVVGWHCQRDLSQCSCTEAYGPRVSEEGHVSEGPRSVGCNGETASCCLYRAPTDNPYGSCICDNSEPCTPDTGERRVTSCPPDPTELE